LSWGKLHIYATQAIMNVHCCTSCTCSSRHMVISREWNESMTSVRHMLISQEWNESMTSVAVYYWINEVFAKIWDMLPLWYICYLKILLAIQMTKVQNNNMLLNWLILTLGGSLFFSALKIHGINLFFFLRYNRSFHCTTPYLKLLGSSWCAEKEFFVQN
jgi:hypothetical protein